MLRLTRVPSTSAGPVEATWTRVGGQVSLTWVCMSRRNQEQGRVSNREVLRIVNVLARDARTAGPSRGDEDVPRVPVPTHCLG